MKNKNTLLVLTIATVINFGFKTALNADWTDGLVQVYQTLPPVIVTGNPIAPIPENIPKGGGLCAQYHALNIDSFDSYIGNFVPMGNLNDNTAPASFFKQSSSFMDETYIYPNQWTANKTINHPLDFQNGLGADDIQKRGDFDPSNILGCPDRGCLFEGYDATDKTTLRSFGYKTTSVEHSCQFMARYRGLLRVTPDKLNQPIHFGFMGFFAGAFGMRIWDKEGNIYYVVRKRSVIAIPGFHVSNQVIFQKSGLYEVEFIYIANNNFAVFEGSYLIGPYRDIEAPDNTINCNTNPDCDHPNFKKDGGFTLLPADWFQQTVSGKSPYSNPVQCMQCVLEQKDVPGNGGCGAGYYCAAGGVCDQCNSSTHCGSDCITCPKDKSVCTTDPLTGKGICLECQADKDCKNGRKCLVGENRCQECLQDIDCPQGKRCDGSFRCVACDQPNACASASCGCCPEKTPLCQNLSKDPSQPQFTCVECTSDAQCVGKGVCDLTNHHCVENIASCNTSTACGNTCEPCLANSEPQKNRPYCLHGQVCAQCRNDLDCVSGTYCLSGDCVGCISDKRCGSTCHPCGGDKPYCLARGSVDSAVCVECMDDSQCGPQGHCDVASHTCQNKCQRNSPCSSGTYCMGSECVECYADSQCCGGVCDMAKHTCQGGCKETGDCLGDECCNTTLGQCEQRRCKSNVTAHGGALCCALPITGEPPAHSLSPSWIPPVLLFGLLLLALVAWVWKKRQQ